MMVYKIAKRWVWRTDAAGSVGRVVESVGEIKSKGRIETDDYDSAPKIYI